MTVNRMASSDYIMEDPREASRLETKVDPRAWVQKYLADLVPPGAEVLSVGCGPGVMVRELSALDSSVHVTGIDISAQRINEALQRNRQSPRTKFVCGDACKMPFPTASFDVVYSRLLMEYLQDKERGVAEMVRVCKPGGRVLLQDLDGQLLWHYPEDAEVQRTVEKVVAALGKTGFDAFVGRKLFWLARSAGLKNLSVQIEPYHLIAGQVDDFTLEQWELKFDIARPQMARILGSEEEAKKQIEKYLQYLRRPDTITYSIVFTVTGEKPL
jgi:SAM-dependent methyltransferase